MSTLDESKDERPMERQQRSNYFTENNSHLILEFDRKADEDIMDSIQGKLENEKFTIAKHGRRFYLTGDELSLLFEAELNGLIKYSVKEQRFKRFKLDDYVDLTELRNPDEATIERLSKILTRTEKLRTCQQMIEDNIQVSKRVFIPTVGRYSTP